MSQHHVNEQLSAYCLGELPAGESRRVSEHLLGCSRCRREYDEVRLGIKFASTLEPVSAPGDLWNQLSVKLGSPVHSSRRSVSFWPTALAVAATLLVASLGAVWYFSRLNDHSQLTVNVPPPPPPPPPVVQPTRPPFATHNGFVDNCVSSIHMALRAVVRELARAPRAYRGADYYRGCGLCRGCERE